MGLAASQARLLFLTARQNDVESQLMSISNQKIALSRESADISRQYANAMNATKLTWDTPDGSTDLTYDLLMHPNTTADDNQYILTNTANGKVILDNDYISGLGIGASGNSGAISAITCVGNDGVTYTGQKAFIMKLIGCDSSTASSYVSAGNTNTQTQNYTISYNDTEIIGNGIGLAAYDGTTTLFSASDSSNWWGGSSTSVDRTSVLTNFDTLLKGYADGLSNAIISSVSGSVSDDYLAMMYSASDYAYAATYAKFIYNLVDADSTDNQIKDSSGNAMSNTSSSFQTGSCENTNRVSAITNSGSSCLGFSSHSSSSATVDNSQLVDTYLNFFDKYLAENSGLGSEYISENTVGATTTTRNSSGTGSNSGTTNPTSDVDSGDADVNSNQVDDAYEASYYINLYNALLAYGWQSNSNIDNKDYLQNQVLYGNIIIQGHINDGTAAGYWENILSSCSSPLSSESDDDAVSQAEADYDAAKDLIDAKETELDVKVNDLDTERSALTTEMESVKSMIKKDVEIFKMFEA